MMFPLSVSHYPSYMYIPSLWLLNYLDSSRRSMRILYAVADGLPWRQPPSAILAFPMSSALSQVYKPLCFLLFVSLLHNVQLLAGDSWRTTKTRFWLYDSKQLDVKDINLSLLLFKKEKPPNLCRQFSRYPAKNNEISFISRNLIGWRDDKRKNSHRALGRAGRDLILEH
jgi:hypothetical protein